MDNDAVFHINGDSTQGWHSYDLYSILRPIWCPVVVHSGVCQVCEPPRAHPMGARVSVVPARVGVGDLQRVVV